MSMNFTLVFIAALVPLVMGFIWYHPKVFGTMWKNETGMTEEKAKSGNMAKTFILTYILSCMLSLVLYTLVIHQSALGSLVMGDESAETKQWLADALAKYGTNFRTFKHGMVHGLFSGIFIVFPILCVNGLFEMKSAKYILLNTGFWIACLIVMGGIICQWG